MHAGLVRLHLFLHRILHFYILFHLALTAVIHPALIAVKHRATYPHSGGAHFSFSDSKPHEAALLRPHFAVFRNLFFLFRATIARHSTSTGLAHERLFIPEIILT